MYDRRTTADLSLFGKLFLVPAFFVAAVAFTWRGVSALKNHSESPWLFLVVGAIALLLEGVLLFTWWAGTAAWARMPVRVALRESSKDKWP